ncbi:MAG: hypothetical protein V7756_17225 [Halopseudomonas sp.]|uniref:hypothetical protein n=1 Tax=Halopseudomonas sp. TaxID=2901191 RepID=UPI003002DB68
MKQTLLIAATLALLAGCTSQPIYNVDDASTAIYNSEFQPSEQQVEQAIMLGATRYGWQPRLVEPGLIEASILLRDHQATVEIPYSAKHFSIHHKSSENLDYKDGEIHRNYNRWVMNLSSAIKQQLSAEAYGGTPEGGQIR